MLKLIASGCCFVDCINMVRKEKGSALLPKQPVGSFRKIRHSVETEDNGRLAVNPIDQLIAAVSCVPALFLPMNLWAPTIPEATAVLTAAALRAWPTTAMHL